MAYDNDSLLGLDTSYIYDDRNDLRYVLTPGYQQEPSLGKFAYCYRYDGFHRCVEKKYPGCEVCVRLCRASYILARRSATWKKRARMDVLSL